MAASPPRPSNTFRSSNGCWTCRLRRKKCDEKRPICDICSVLLITCHYQNEKPEWMDGGARQEEMVDKLKREVKQQAPRRRGGALLISNDNSSGTDRTSEEWVILPQADHANEIGPCPDMPTTPLQPSADYALAHKDCEKVTFGGSDTILLMFYLEHLLPFLFPFYRPSPLQEGRAWILEMMISSPVVRQATLCQSSYFFSLARGSTDKYGTWDSVLAQTENAFSVLRQSLQVIDGSRIAENLHCAVRIMASIMQIHRYEIAILSFKNYQIHLNAALDIFKQLLDSTGVDESRDLSSRFETVKRGLSSGISFTQFDKIPSAEESAFCFSSTLLILDDIVASTVLGEEPRLYKYHRGLLGQVDSEPPINLKNAVGCQNWVLLQIGEVSALNAWKQHSKILGNLDVMKLVHQATPIKYSIESGLSLLETVPETLSCDCDIFLGALTADYDQQTRLLTGQSTLITCAWAHAALLYLSIVVSGWQPSSTEVRHHVGKITDLLSRIQPPILLRTVLWPFCVAGCLAEPSRENWFREIVEALQPPSVFGTIYRALEIMEDVWRNRDAENACSRDLASCFRMQGDLILLV